MSASREKKTRQDLSGSGWNDPKTAREAKQRQKEHSTNLLYGTIGVVFLVIAIAAVIWKSNIIPKTAFPPAPRRPPSTVRSTPPLRSTSILRTTIRTLSTAITAF
jgi:cytoskeletal protein RodZ